MRVDIRVVMAWRIRYLVQVLDVTQAELVIYKCTTVSCLTHGVKDCNYDSPNVSIRIFVFVAVGDCCGASKPTASRRKHNAIAARSPTPPDHRERGHNTVTLFHHCKHASCFH